MLSAAVSSGRDFVMTIVVLSRRFEDERVSKLMTRVFERLFSSGNNTKTNGLPRATDFHGIVYVQ
jgi:hypothetical protein